MSAIIRYSTTYSHFLIFFENETFTIPWAGRERLPQWLRTVAEGRRLAYEPLDLDLNAGLIAGMKVTNDLLLPPTRRQGPIAKVKGQSAADLLKELDL